MQIAQLTLWLPVCRFLARSRKITPLNRSSCQLFISHLSFCSLPIFIFTYLLLSGLWKTCLTSPEKILLIARGTDIRQISIDEDDFKDYSAVILPIQDIENAIVLDYDPVEGRVYWADDDLRAIKRAYLNGSNPETIIATEIHNPAGIALDTVNRNIFFTDAGTNRIEVARLDGSSRTTIISEGLDKPRAIALHPQSFIFWSDWGENARIERAAFDGSDRRTLVNTSIEWPNGLAIDYELSTLFWCDAKLDKIEKIQFDGSERQMIWSDQNLHFFGFSLFEEWIYWSDWQDGSVKRIHKLTHESRETIVEHLPGLMGIKVVSVRPQPQFAQLETSSCSTDNGGCSHLCLNRPQRDYVCVCPANYELAIDQRTCNISEAFFVLLRKTDIRKISIASKKLDSLFIDGLQLATSFDINIANNTVFWVDSKLKAIFRSDLKHFLPKLVVQFSGDAAQNIAIDWISHNLYWTSAEQKRIEVARSDGSFRRILFYDSKAIPHSLAIDPISGFLFFSLSDSSKERIYRASLDGERREIIVDSAGKISSLTLDYTSERLYWIVDSKQIRSCSYDGSSKTILMHGNQSKISSLALFGEVLFYLDHTNQTIESINKRDPTQRREVKRTELIASAAGLFIQHPITQKGWNYCAHSNGDCQHLCFFKPQPKLLNGRASFQKIKDDHGLESIDVQCSCATHYRLESEGIASDQRQLNCLPPESFLIFTHRNEFTRFLFDPRPEENVKYIYQDVTVAIPGTKLIKVLTYDPYDQYIYLIDGKYSIRRIFLNGSKVEEVIPSNDYEIFDLALDPYSRLLFWTSSNTINAVRLLNQSTSIQVVHEAKTDSPRLLAYHYQQNYLFWTNDLQNSQIERISMATGKRSTLITNMFGLVLSLTVEQDLGYIFWACKLSGTIEYSNLDGTTRAALYRERDIQPMALAAHSKYLFWIEKEKSVEKVPIDLNKGRNKQTIFTRTSTLNDIIAVTSIKSSPNLPCMNETNGCSHFCIMMHNNNTTKCACPKGLVLASNGTTCIEPTRCEHNKFACHDDFHCIQAYLVCNGSPDCDDSSDELNCPTCGPTKFACLRNIIEHEFVCLDKELICDNKTDCVEGYDERCCDTETEFACNNGHCLSIHQLCDDKMDCGPSGEDEDRAICRLHSLKSPVVSPHTFTYSLFMIAALATFFIVVLCFQCTRCFIQREKEVTDILMTEQNPLSAFSVIRNTQHRTKFSYNKKYSLKERARMEVCNTLTSTTTISGLDTLPNESQNRHDVPFGGNVATAGPSTFHSFQSEPLINPNMTAPSSNSSDPVRYPYETINPPPSPVTERSQSVYSSHSSSLFVPRIRTRNKNGVLSTSKSNGNTRRPKKSRWNKRALRGPPPTPCGTDVYEDLEPSTVKYIFYDNAHAEMDIDYKPPPPPPTPRHYFSDASCPPSPVTEHSFCNINLNPPPPPSPVQDSD